MNYTEKYNSLVRREFLKQLDIYVTMKVCKLFDIEDFEKFLSFESSKKYEVRKAYVKLFQTNEANVKIGNSCIETKKIDNEIDQWYKIGNDEIIKYEEIFKKYFSTSQNDIEQIFTGTKKECHYCGINEETIKEMLDVNSFNTIRFYYNRGRGLEIDRKDPLKGYEKDNLVLCCYWCNNAKTDEFDDKEFKAIGSVIGLIWEKRNPDKQT